MKLPWTQASFWYSLLPIALVSAVRQAIGLAGTDYAWWHPAAALAIAESSFTSALFVTAGGMFIYVLFRHSAPVVLWALVYSLAATIDALFIMYSRMRWSWSLLHDSLRATSIYFEPWIVAAFLFALSASNLSLWLSIRTASASVLVEAKQRLIFSILVLIVAPSALVIRGTLAPFPAASREAIESNYIEAKRFSLNPLLELGLSIITKSGARRVVSYEDAERKLLAPFLDESEPQVPMGKKVRRIIFITMESMSMTLTSRYNQNLPGPLTPFIDTLPESVRDLRSVSLPTAFGLASHLCGHPNGQALTEAGHPNAVPAHLARHGWTTMLMQSASLKFQSGSRRFREMGYQNLFGSDEAASDRRLAPYISGWGLCDRKVYEAAVEWLDAHRNDQVFLHILTADTHAPIGRTNWHDLPYPPEPTWISKSGRPELYLRSWYRADYDLKLLFDKLVSRGLFDDQTAVIITGDHAAPGGPIYSSIPGTGRETIERIPWILVTKRPDYTLRLNRFSSQSDTAPTIAQLAGLAPLPAWWGRSLLSDAVDRPLLAWRDRRGFQLNVNRTTSAMPEEIDRIGWAIEIETKASR